MRTRVSRLRAGAGGAALALALVLAGCGAGEESQDQQQEQVEAAALLGQHVDAATFLAGVSELGATVIDVRTPEEFAGGHIAGAVNIDVNAADAPERFAALDPTTTYAVYCRSGNRSRTAMALMQDAGIESAFGLEGGVGALSPEDLVTN